jgi:Alpha-glucosidases, family 31 of glycosyl hydrolases
LLGPSLLVSPVFTADGTTHTYLPAGSWTHVLDGRRIEGGRWVTDKYGFDSLGIFLRGDTVLPLGARSDRPDYEWADGVTLVLNDLSEAHKSSLSVGGFQFEVSRTGENIQIVTDSPFAWTAQLNGLKTAFPAGTQQGTITSGTGKSDAPII